MNKTNACLCHEALLAFCSPVFGAVAGQGLSGATFGRKNHPGTFRVGDLLGSEALWIHKGDKQEQPAWMTENRNAINLAVAILEHLACLTVPLPQNLNLQGPSFTWGHLLYLPKVNST